MRAPIITREMFGDGYAEWETREISIKDPPFNAAGDGVTDDTAAIQKAINENRSIFFPDGNYLISSPLILPRETQMRGIGKARTKITLTADITAFIIENVNDAEVFDMLIEAYATQTAPIFHLLANTVTITRNNFRRIQITGWTTDFPIVQFNADGWGIWNCNFEDIVMGGCGTVVELNSDSPSSWINSNKFLDFHIVDMIIGIDMTITGGDGSNNNIFRNWNVQCSARTTFGLRIAAAAPNQNAYNILDGVVWYDMTIGGTYYNIGLGVIGTQIIHPTGDVIRGIQTTDRGFSTQVPGAYDYIAKLMAAGHFLPIPTASGWTETVTASGTTESEAAYNLVRTGVTVNSTARRFTGPIGGFSSVSQLAIDFSKQLIFTFNIARTTAEANAIGRVQLKTVTTEGALAAKGIGIRISDFTITGESYGTSGQDVNLGPFVLDPDQSVQVMIILYPSAPRIEWWLDGIFIAAQTDAAKIPTLSTVCRLIHSIITTISDPSADAQQFLLQPRLWVAK